MDFTTIIWAVVVLGALAIVFGLILAVAAKVFEVEVDPRLPEIQACLAGANCGGCGYPGCAGCAEAILAGKAPVTACAPAGVYVLKGEGLTVPYVTYDGKDSVHFFSVPDTYTYQRISDIPTYINVEKP